MARNRRNPMQNPRNSGLNRTASVRGNNRGVGANTPFQGGLSLGQGVGSLPGIQRPGDVPVVGGTPGQNRGQCPPGSMPRTDPRTGAPTCVPATKDPGSGLKRRVGAGVPGPNTNGTNKPGY